MKRLIVSLLTIGTALSSFASQILIKDLFDDNDLSTYANTQDQVNGGFGIIGNGNGDVTESGTIAQIRNSSNKNDVYGMLSSSTFSLSGGPGETALRTFWEIDKTELKSKASYIAFSWQSYNSLTNIPEIYLVLDFSDSQQPQAELYINTTNSPPAAFVDVNYDGDAADGFTVEAIFTETGYKIIGGGALTRSADSDIELLEGDWSETKSHTNYRVGALVNAKGTAGLIADISSVTVEAIPEPAAVALVGLFGGGLLFARRIFKG